MGHGGATALDGFPGLKQVASRGETCYNLAPLSPLIEDSGVGCIETCI